MIRRITALGAMPLLAMLLCQCGSEEPGPVLVGETQAKIEKGDALFLKGQAEERKGDLDDAIDIYDDVASDYPYCNMAGEARYRQAMLLEREREIRDAVKAYNQFLDNHPSHPKYGEALESLFKIAEAARINKGRKKFLLFNDDFSVLEKIDLLESIKKHAPKSNMAAQAQYAIAETHLEVQKVLFVMEHRDYHKAVAAFRKVADDHRDHPLAPEALFRVGKILLEDAERGNQNQANVDLSREAFNDYLIQYPGHKRNAEARKMIASLNARDLQRTMDIAEYYFKTGNKASAAIYYRDIIKRSKSGDLHDKAQARLKELAN